MLPVFLRELWNVGRVRIGVPQPVEPDARSEAAELLADFEQAYRLAMPGEPPAFDSEAAIWAAVSFYSAAALVINRDFGEGEFPTLFGQNIPDKASAGTHYSVDLTMRFLPDLIKLAKSAAIDDPLVKRLMEWAVAWPLSSVGIDLVGQVDTTPIRTSPTLMRLYVDRVIATSDYSRLDDDWVVEMAKESFGNYPQLCPSIATHIETH